MFIIPYIIGYIKTYLKYKFVTVHVRFHKGVPYSRYRTNEIGFITNHSPISNTIGMDALETGMEQACIFYFSMKIHQKSCEASVIFYSTHHSTALHECTLVHLNSLKH